MPTFKVTDSFQAEVTGVPIQLNPLASLLGKYSTGSNVTVVLLPSLAGALKQSLFSAGQQPVSLQLQFQEGLNLSGTSGPSITIGAGVSQHVGINSKFGSTLLPDLFGSPIAVQAGEAWLSLGLNGTVSSGSLGKQGNFKFGLDLGTVLSAEYYRRFQANAEHPTLGEALGEVLSDMTFPASVEDLLAMRTGDLSIVSGTGTLKISGSVAVAVSANPLASPSLPIVNQSATLQASASVTASASLTLSGTYQMRVRRLSENRVELGYYRKKGAQWSVSLSASARISASAGKTDYLAKLLASLTGQPEVDVAKLLTAGLSQGQIERIQEEVARGIDHSVAASLTLELSQLDAEEAAFRYQIDLQGLTDNSREALEFALAGDLSKLAQWEASGAPGITQLRSALRNIRDRKASFKLNLIGLLNFSSVFDLLKKSEIVFEPQTGELTISETVSGTRIGALTTPAAEQKLRKVRFDSLLMTSAYRASRSVSMGISSSGTHFVFNQQTSPQILATYLNQVLAVGLKSSVDSGPHLNAFTGPSTFLLRVEFSDRACQAMFLNAAAQPRPLSNFENLGRHAMADLLPAGETDSSQERRGVLLNAGLWAQLKEAGPPSFERILPAPARKPVPLEVIKTDFVAVTWWAESMASTAEKLFAVSQFVQTADPSSLSNNPRFEDLRNALQQHVAALVAHSGMQFGLPFGLVALYRAAAPFATADSLIVLPEWTKHFTPEPASEPASTLPIT